MTEHKKKKMNAKELIEGLIYDTELIVSERPYHAFSILCVEIEILGKCLNADQWHKGIVRENFYNAINKLSALKKYRKYNFKEQSGRDNNRLYEILRCGMLHAGFPTDDTIKLGPQENNLSKDIIGCRELYDDILAAWNALKNNSALCVKNLQEERMYINGIISAATASQINQ